MHGADDDQPQRRVIGVQEKIGPAKFHRAAFIAIQRSGSGFI